MSEPPSEDHDYYLRKFDAEEIASNYHREFVGGAWEELGQWQSDLLHAEGLQPYHRLLDLGCGCLRGGVHLLDWLEPANYFGIDCNRSLLDLGLTLELPRAGLSGALRNEQLSCRDDYAANVFGVTFDYVLAQSLWSHLPLTEVRLSLLGTAPAVRSGGLLLATYFRAPAGTELPEELVHSPGGVRSFAAADPFHFRDSDLLEASAGTGWRWLGSGRRQHPRGQWVSRWQRE